MISQINVEGPCPREWFWNPVPTVAAAVLLQSHRAVQQRRRYLPPCGLIGNIHRCWRAEVHLHEIASMHGLTSRL